MYRRKEGLKKRRLEEKKARRKKALTLVGPCRGIGC
jgi:hypothetical protein